MSDTCQRCGGGGWELSFVDADIKCYRCGGTGSEPMTDRDFNTLLAGIEAGLYRIASNEKLGVYGRQELADGALEALADLRTRIEKVEALPEKWEEYARALEATCPDPHDPSYVPSIHGPTLVAAQAAKEHADELTRALQGGGK